MAYKVIITSKAQKDLRKVDGAFQKRIKSAIDNLGQSLPDRPTNWTHFQKGTPPNAQYGADGKLTVGKYRVLTIIDDAANRVFIPRIFKRGDRAYGFSESAESYHQYKKGDRVIYTDPISDSSSGRGKVIWSEIENNPDWEPVDFDAPMVIVLLDDGSRVEAFPYNLEPEGGPMNEEQGLFDEPVEPESTGEPTYQHYVVADEEGVWMMEQPPTQEEIILVQTNDPDAAERAMTRASNEWYEGMTRDEMIEWALALKDIFEPPVMEDTRNVLRRIIKGTSR